MRSAVPSFNSERAEAAWWEIHRAAIEDDLRAALRARRSAPAREVMTKGHKRKLVPAAIVLTGAELDAARKIAEDRGISYEAYIKILLNDSRAR